MGDINMSQKYDNISFEELPVNYINVN